MCWESVIFIVVVVVVVVGAAVGVEMTREFFN